MADVIFIVISIIMFLIASGMFLWTVLFVMKDHTRTVKELQEKREELYKTAEQYRAKLEMRKAKFQSK